VAIKNSRKPFNLLHYVNALCALLSFLRYFLPHEDRPAFNLAKEMRNSEAFAMLLHGASQQFTPCVCISCL